MTKVHDASIEAERITSDNLRRVRLAQEKSGDGSRPILDVYIMAGSSRIFLRSIVRDSDDLGISCRIHDLGDATGLPELEDDLSELRRSGTNGVLFIRPPYSYESYDDVSFILDRILSTVPDSCDVDRIGYRPFEGVYPPVVEAVRIMIESFRGNYIFRDTKAVVIGNSTFVGKPIATMSSDLFDQVEQLHLSTDRSIVNNCTRDADVIITYRPLEDIDLNPDSYVIDVGRDDSYKLLSGKVREVTSHIGKLTTAILLSNVIDNYCIGR